MLGIYLDFAALSSRFCHKINYKPEFFFQTVFFILKKKQLKRKYLI